MSSHVTWMRLDGVTQGRGHLITLDEESEEFVTLCGFSIGKDSTILVADEEADERRCRRCRIERVLRWWSQRITRVLH